MWPETKTNSSAPLIHSPSVCKLGSVCLSGFHQQLAFGNATCRQCVCVCLSKMFNMKSDICRRLFSHLPCRLTIHQFSLRSIRSHVIGCLLIRCHLYYSCHICHTCHLLLKHKYCCTENINSPTSQDEFLYTIKLQSFCLTCDCI